MSWAFLFTGIYLVVDFFLELLVSVIHKRDLGKFYFLMGLAFIFTALILNLWPTIY